jgi:type IV secretory pathway TrbF-like protein
MTGIFPVKVEKARDEEDLRVNPLGIRIDAGFQWSKDA